MKWAVLLGAIVCAVCACSGGDRNDRNAAVNDGGARHTDAALSDGAVAGDSERGDGKSRDAAAPDAPDASDEGARDSGSVADGGSMGDAATCDPSIGWTVPLTVCSKDRPCTEPLPLYDAPALTESTDVPESCDTGTFGTDRGRPTYGSDPLRTYIDADGTTRYYCEYRPTGASQAAPRPLVLFVHGSGGGARSVYDATSLRAKATSFDLSGPGSDPGFILVAVQGRNLHWPTLDPQDGSKHDTFHRDLGAPSENRDVALYDTIVDGLVAEGVVDSHQIYLMGWSNGARFAAMYGIGRHTRPTAGGNRVAAIANYSGGDPFENTQPSQAPSCKQTPYPQAELPVMMISRACDVIACDGAQAEAIGGVPPGNVAADWVGILTSQVGASPVDWRIIGDRAEPRTGCALSCTLTRALRNHTRWPDGIQDGSDTDLEPELLGFLRDHPLP